MPRRALLICLSVALTSALVSCGTSTGVGEADGTPPAQVEGKLRQLAAEAGRPVYYLGPRFRDWPLADALADETGRVDALYGDCVGDSESCAHRIDVINDVLDPEKWSRAAGCSRLPPVRGVPAVHFGDAVVLLTGDLLITIGVLEDDTATAVAAADQVREVGADAPDGALPPPETAALRVLDAACGRSPGDASRTEADLDVGTLPHLQVPDFTVDRLRGGKLRWAAYTGTPVVVVAGDVPHVVSGVRRVLDLRTGPPPAVIGLIWKPFSSKESPPPIEQIEKEAGATPVPVGYAAIPQPAVWFFDRAEVDPAQAGVIAFVNAGGDLVHHLPTDAPTGKIATALADLTR